MKNEEFEALKATEKEGLTATIWLTGSDSNPCTRDIKGEIVTATGCPT